MAFTGNDAAPDDQNQPTPSVSDSGYRTPSFNQAFNVQESLKKQPAKSILKKTNQPASPDPGRRMSKVADITAYNQLVGKVENLDQILTTDQGLLDTSSQAHKSVVQELARQVQEEAPRYAIRSVYNEFLPCLKKINQHYHKIAVGASTEHPDLKDCDDRLAWATDYVRKMNDLI